MRSRDIEEEQIIPVANSNRIGLVQSFKNYSSKVNWTVFWLISLFTIGSWIDLSGIWSELPLMVNELPEGWRLPAIISAITQLAQIGTLFFLFGRFLAPKIFTFERAIYFIFSLGLISCVLLSIFWNQTEKIHNENRNGMSSVTFLPYIGGYYTKEYIIPNYIGESLSSLLPAVLSMLQGYQKITNCTLYNLTNKSDDLINSTKISVNYSVSIYFIFMFTLLFISLISFTLLNHSRTAIGARKIVFESLNDIVLSERSADSISYNSNADTVSISSVQFVASDKKKEIFLLLSLAFSVSFLYYGFLPGLISYSTMPYGDVYFHLAINLSYLFLPFSIIISIWSYHVSTKRIILELTIAILLSLYIVTIAALSPCPPLVNSSVGGVVIVIVWILSSCLFMRVRCLISASLESHGQNMLFVCGYANILGQIIGGLFIYLIVDVFRVLREREKCSFKLC